MEYDIFGPMRWENGSAHTLIRETIVGNEDNLNDPE